MFRSQSGHRELEITLGDRFAKVPISGEGDLYQISVMNSDHYLDPHPEERVRRMRVSKDRLGQRKSFETGLRPSSG